ncbi:MAG: hypothetical protein L3J68_00160 [Thermoplasmata archaeon]|nr:hypothetical protein [Thermoplasmata archaeon]
MPNKDEVERVAKGATGEAPERKLSRKELAARIRKLAEIDDSPAPLLKE